MAREYTNADGKEQRVASPEGDGIRKEVRGQSGEWEPNLDSSPKVNKSLDYLGTPGNAEQVGVSGEGDEENDYVEFDETDLPAEGGCSLSYDSNDIPSGEDEPFDALELNETRQQRLYTRKRIANATRPKIQADTLRALFYSMDRAPFLDLLTYITGCSPDPEAMIEFADKSPLHWAQMISVFAKLGGYTEKTESVNTNILVEMGKMSDVELMAMMRELDDATRPLIEQVPIAEGGKNLDNTPIIKEPANVGS